MYGHHFSHFDVEKGEFVCPVCARLFNCVLPMLPALKKEKEESGRTFSQWCQEMRTYAVATVKFSWILGRRCQLYLNRQGPEYLVL